MLQNILGSEPGHVGWHFINCKPDVMQCSLLLVIAHVGLVLLGHTHLQVDCNYWKKYCCNSSMIYTVFCHEIDKKKAKTHI